MNPEVNIPDMNPAATIAETISAETAIAKPIAAEYPLRGESIICFAGEDWWYHNPHSKNHILKRLVRHNRVLFVNSITMGLPSIGNADFFIKVRRKLRSYMRWLRRTPEGLWVMTPINIPVYSSPLVRKLNRMVLLLQFRLVMMLLRLHQPIIWAAIPTSADIVDALGAKLLVYQVSDKYDHQEDSALAGDVIRKMDARLKQLASVVMYSGKKLYEEAEIPHRYFLEQAVDFERFANLPPGVPDDVANVPRPVLGYIGSSDWFTMDAPLIEYVAQQRPNWHWVFVGGKSKLLKLSGPNLHFVGQKSYAELPRYYRHMDVCVLPWNQQNVFTNYGSAIKVKEYFATGLPVVLSPLYEYLNTPGVRFYRTPDEFIAQVEDALANDTPQQRKLRQEAVRDATWDVRAEQVAVLFRELLDDPNKFKSPERVVNDAVLFHSPAATTWDAGYETPVYSVRKDIIMDLLAERDLTDQQWLDAGCATGTLARFLSERKGCRVLGVDACEAMIQNATRTPLTEFKLIDDVCTTGVPDAAVDGVLCSSVIEYVPHPAVALREFHRIMKEDGTLLLSVPSAHPVVRWPVVALYWLTKPLGRHRVFTYLDHSKHSYSESSLRRLLNACGFRMEAARTYGGPRGKPILGHGSLLMVRARKV